MGIPQGEEIELEDIKPPTILLFLPVISQSELHR